MTEGECFTVPASVAWLLGLLLVTVVFTRPSWEIVDKQ